MLAAALPQVPAPTADRAPTADGSVTADRAAAVRCRNVVKAFGRGEARVPVLRGADFAAAAGEITFLVGPSGCGKTTLISILGGLLTPDGGDVSLFGTDRARLRGGALADFRLANLGFIFQQFNLLPTLTIAENAAVPLLARGVSGRKARAAAVDLLTKLGLEKHLDKHPQQLSGGQQQRTAIARALVHEPRLVICDEPTASLDAESGRAVMQLLREIALRPGRAVIVVTHDPRIYPFADRIAFMSDGVVTHSATAEAANAQS